MVEDNEVNQKLITRILQKLGHQVRLAQHGKEAIEMLMERSYDLVLMDCQMPVMDGFEATAEIRSGIHPTINPELIIIAVTANAIQGDRERILAAGMNDYLRKPLEIEDFKRCLNHWLSKSRL